MLFSLSKRGFKRYATNTYYAKVGNDCLVLLSQRTLTMDYDKNNIFAKSTTAIDETNTLCFVKNHQNAVYILVFQGLTPIGVLPPTRV